jgi:hypothetical protein
MLLACGKDHCRSTCCSDATNLGNSKVRRRGHRRGLGYLLMAPSSSLSPKAQIKSNLSSIYHPPHTSSLAQSALRSAAWSVSWMVKMNTVELDRGDYRSRRD